MLTANYTVTNLIPPVNLTMPFWKVTKAPVIGVPIRADYRRKGIQAPVVRRTAQARGALGAGV